MAEDPDGCSPADAAAYEAQAEQRCFGGTPLVPPGFQFVPTKLAERNDSYYQQVRRNWIRFHQVQNLAGCVHLLTGSHALVFRLFGFMSNQGVRVIDPLS